MKSIKAFSSYGVTKGNRNIEIHLGIHVYMIYIYIYIIIYVVACRDIVKSDILLNIYFMSAK